MPISDSDIGKSACLPVASAVRGLSRRLDADRDGFGICYLNLIAHFELADELPALWRTHWQGTGQTIGPIEAHDVAVVIYVRDSHGLTTLSAYDACGPGPLGTAADARFDHRRVRLAGVIPAPAQFRCQSLIVAGDHAIAHFDLCEVSDRGRDLHCECVPLWAAQSNHAFIDVDRFDGGGDFLDTFDGDRFRRLRCASAYQQCEQYRGSAQTGMKRRAGYRGQLRK